MIGFVEADTGALTEAQRLRYRGAYCGLCRELRDRHGNLSRLSLSNDMTFLSLLLNSLYEPEEHSGTNLCGIHPMKPRGWWRSKYSAYAADMGLALAYYNLMDDWVDEKRLAALGGARLLRQEFEKVRVLWPEQCDSLECCLKEISEIERAREPLPDAAANCFGKWMGLLFDPEHDSVWGGHLRSFGEALGRFIYMMDACIDLKKDQKHGSYNPLLVLGGDPVNEEEQLALLKMLIAECTAEFEFLPLVQDAEILRSVLYSGVWHQYAIKKRGKRDTDGQ